MKPTPTKSANDYIRMRDAWITLANRCEFMPISDVTDK
jgi:hypothetical protein